jgi:hypothetical protein
VTSIRVVMLLALSAAVAGAQTDSSAAPLAAPANDVFRMAPRVGAADTSESGTDVFRRASVRREMSARSPDRSQDSVTIDGARVALDTAHAAAAVTRDDITEHLARPVRKPSVAVAPPAPASPAAAPPAVVPQQPVVAPPTPAPAPAPEVALAPAVVEAHTPAPAPAPVVTAPVVSAPVKPVVRPTPRPASTPTVKPPPPTDSAQLVREVAELQRDVAPKLHTVGVQLDSVREAYQANLDRLEKLEKETPLTDTTERRLLDQTIAAARFKNDTTMLAPATTSTSKKAKKAKTQTANN